MGVLVTAFLMAMLNPPEKLTDAQIKQRAAALGMVEEKYLSEVSQGEAKEPLKEESAPKSAEEIPAEEIPEANSGEAPIEEASEDENSGEENPKEPNSQEGDVQKPDTPTETEEPTENITAEDNAPAAPEAVENYIVITIERGNGSDTVSRKLFEAGLIDSAAEYDKYLMANGYDRKLSIGNHEIPVGATEEEMAKILCGQK